MRQGPFQLLILLPLALAATASPSLERSFDAHALRKLELDQANGKVTIAASEGKQARVVGTRKSADQACEVKVEADGSTLKIVNKLSAARPNARCEVDWHIEVPAQAALNLRIGVGDLEIDGMRGALAYHLGAGNVALDGTDLPSLDGKSGSGDVRIRGALRDAELRIGAGDADIALSAAPAGGSLELRVGSGSAVVKLPKDSKVHSDFRAGIGSLTNEFGNASGRAFKVSGSAGTGNLTIRKS